MMKAEETKRSIRMIDATISFFVAWCSARWAAHSTTSPRLLERWPESITVTFSKDFAASKAF